MRVYGQAHATAPTAIAAAFPVSNVVASHRATQLVDWQVVHREYGRPTRGDLRKQVRSSCSGARETSIVDAESR